MPNRSPDIVAYDRRFRKEEEIEDIQIFLDAYERATGEVVEIEEVGESPDAICRRPDGTLVGIEHTRVTQRAETLIAEPPRRRMTLGLKWSPDQPPPIKTTEELFQRGICQVRHNLAHGEKFNLTGEGWDRDVALVTQSLWVLERAIENDQRFKELRQSGIVAHSP